MIPLNAYTRYWLLYIPNDKSQKASSNNTYTCQGAMVQSLRVKAGGA
jgi:hypothetical protein